MTIKYQACIIAIGPLVAEFIDARVLVLFGENAPPELAEFAIIHNGRHLDAEVCPGDRIQLGEYSFQVTAVGEVANQNLRALGHLVIKFNGQTVPEMPGDVCAEVIPLPPIGVGMHFQIDAPE